MTLSNREKGYTFLFSLFLVSTVNLSISWSIYQQYIELLEYKTYVSIISLITFF